MIAAVILDEDSEPAFGYEWEQVEFGPDDWRTVFVERHPILLFVESARHGNHGRWRGLLHKRSELSSVIEWCRAERIPSVFWNNGDPGDFDDFWDVAALFDCVFTCDGDTLAKYREALGHDRIDVLPFAAQPRLHNPIQNEVGRLHDVAYAGKYPNGQTPEFREWLESVLRRLCTSGLHILASGGRHEWPTELVPHIVGDLADINLSTVATLYKVFVVAATAESRARRDRQVIELSVCATPIVSCPASVDGKTLWRSSRAAACGCRTGRPRR